MPMKLLTKELRNKLPRLYSQEDVKDPIVHIKFFHPFSDWYWFATEGEPILNDAGKEVDFHFFGYVVGQFNELGYFSLNELKTVKVMGCPMERDLYFDPTPLSEIKQKYNGQ